ncbi:MAG: GNAT family N-acetyltransferase [Chloroflexi bacterium]|nr:GNAT family N-acetyltransferase [Chloroflexota bacterium]
MANPPGSDISVRKATRADLDTVIQFNLALAWESEGRSLDLARLRTGVEAVFDGDGRGFYLVAEMDGRVVGQLLITHEWSDWRNAFFWWIQSVYVSAEYRRQGIYRTLHSYVLAEARRQGDVCGLRLYVDRDNSVAQRVYSGLDMQQARYDMFEIDFVL